MKKSTLVGVAALVAAGLSTGCTESPREPSVEVASSQPATGGLALQVGIDPKADGKTAITFFDGFGAAHPEVLQSTVRIDQRAAVFLLKPEVTAATAATLAEELRASELVTRVVVQPPAS